MTHGRGRHGDPGTRGRGRGGRGGRGNAGHQDGYRGGRGDAWQHRSVGRGQWQGENPEGGWGRYHRVPRVGDQGAGTPGIQSLTATASNPHGGETLSNPGHDGLRGPGGAGHVVATQLGQSPGGEPLSSVMGTHMDRHRLEALVTREPRHRLEILVGLEMLDTEMGIWMLDIKEMGMGMLDIKVGIERLDTMVVVGLARLDTT